MRTPGMNPDQWATHVGRAVLDAARSAQDLQGRSEKMVTVEVSGIKPYGCKILVRMPARSKTPAPKETAR